MDRRITLLFGHGVSREVDGDISSRYAAPPCFTSDFPSGASTWDGVREIHREVSDRCLRFRYPEWPLSSVSRMCEGFDHADMFTLCYDDFLDSALYDPQDGFDAVGGVYEGHGAYSVFDPELVFETSGRNSLNHLNGSVFMSRHPGSGSLGPMYKFDSPQKLTLNESQGSRDASFSQILPYPADADSFLYDPFRTYRAHLIECVSRNRRTVVAGYGFEDRFVNELLRTFATGDGNKVLFVCPEPPEMFNLSETGFGGADVTGRVIWFKGTIRDVACSASFPGVMEQFRSGPDRVRE